MDMMPMLFVKSLVGMQASGQVEVTFSAGSLVYDSRNTLARKAIEKGFDRVLWLDSDMVFPADLFHILGAHLDGGMDMVTGLYFSRKRPVRPTVFSKIWMDGKVARADVVTEIPEQLFEIAACGFGAVMMKTEVLQKVAGEFGMPFSPVLGFGEDISFCMRATHCGYKIWCDPRIRLGHIGYKEYSAEDYGGKT
jgi:GT2 family glycosyltransferase